MVDGPEAMLSYQYAWAEGFLVSGRTLQALSPALRNGWPGRSQR
jgi:hypothetical protein